MAVFECLSTLTASFYIEADSRVEAQRELMRIVDQTVPHDFELTDTAVIVAGTITNIVLGDVQESE